MRILLRIKVRLIFRWFDLWVGVFVDVPKRCVYVFPVPCLGLRIELVRKKGGDLNEQV